MRARLTFLTYVYLFYYIGYRPRSVELYLERILPV